ncbi:enoyl-CoA hydratase/isomerase family protein [Roseomonas sp. NAR14]|uniref:Enoyl-CoA hydratase/isomerase family protein n=1 Tax=Roseomonas acroporae TaxID=2937791 RepID=A0A9X2BW64_9PROT|nr:enoyl-CoA hydratase/isomerase family protein [Roseomonas acroporae]MCK8787438.1 enoyl-CoA hydratase/isomerase family protein [Roseomonas acroporae]
MIRRENDGKVRILSLERPEKRNALNRALAESLLAELRAVMRDQSVIGVVLGGAGPSFCAGEDLGENRAYADDRDARLARFALGEKLLRITEEIGKPVVAAVQGAAMGAGAAMALSCDMVVAEPGARFAFPEARHDILPVQMVPILQRHLGPKLTFELLATGRDVPAEEALRLGLVNRIVPSEKLREEAVRLVHAAALLSPSVMLSMKALCSHGPQGIAAGFASARTVWQTRL